MNIVTEETLHVLASRLGECMKARKMTLAAAESCSGGWLAKIITDLPGSSSWFEGSVVSYSNAMKQQVLGVSAFTLDEFGAVSGETVLEMCDGLLENTSADVVVSISGIAGPDGGSEDRPVGLVWLCRGRRGKSTQAFAFNFSGDREAVRLQTLDKVLNELLDLLCCSY